jgi:mannose-6-phosphate isomerase class I
MSAQVPLYPLRSTPMYQYRLWGGQRLANWLRAPPPDETRILVCLEGIGALEHNRAAFGMEKGAAVLLPAAVGACRLRPESSITLLEIAIQAPP